MSRGSTEYVLLMGAVGVTLTAVAAPPIAVLAAAGIDPEPVTTLVGTVGLVGATGVAWATLDPNAPSRVHTGGTSVVLVGTPALYGCIAVVVGLTGGSGGWTTPFAAGAVGGVPAGVGAVYVATRRDARQARRESDHCTEWCARSADRPGAWVRHLGLAGGTVGVALGAVLTLGDDDAVGVATVVAGAAGTAAVYATGRRRTYAAVDQGLIRGRRRRPWSAFEAYEVTDAALVVHARRRGRTVRVDREDVGDEAAVTAALDRYLSERGGPDGDP